MAENKHPLLQLVETFSGCHGRWGIKDFPGNFSPARGRGSCLLTSASSGKGWGEGTPRNVPSRADVPFPILTLHPGKNVANPQGTEMSASGKRAEGPYPGEWVGDASMSEQGF